MRLTADAWQQAIGRQFLRQLGQADGRFRAALRAGL